MPWSFRARPATGASTKISHTRGTVGPLASTRCYHGDSRGGDARDRWEGAVRDGGVGAEVPEMFGALLRRHRLAAGLTQEALAERAGVSVRNIQALERGINKPYRDTLTRVAAALTLEGEDRAHFAAAALATPRRPTTSDGPAAQPAAATTRAAHARVPLPASLTSFVGRTREIALVRELTRQGVRLVTLTGVGGTGKTRLALQVAQGLREDFPDGIAFVDLSTIRDPALAPATIAHALGLRGGTDRTLPDRLTAYLRPRRLLLLLDNVEHVLSAAPLVGQLLAAAPGTSVLATSRVPLRLYGEREVRVPPLGVPGPRAARAETPTDPLDHEAVHLFLERARALRPDLTPTPDTLAAVGDICRRLDGLPLAIELAAARAKLFAPPALLARLDSRLALLTDGPRDLPARQQTLRGTLDWSFELLTGAVQSLFSHLAVFDDGWDVEAAAAVCASDADAEAAPGGHALAGLVELTDHGLVTWDDDADGEPRFRMLETIREYAAARLAESGETDALRRRHAVYYLDLAERAERELIGPEQVAWLRLLEREHANVRAALGALLNAGEGTAAPRLAAALERFWIWRGHLSEGIGWLQAALALDDAAGPECAKALVVAGSLATSGGDSAQAERLLAEGLAIYQDLGDERGIARALAAMGAPAIWAGDLALCLAYHEQALDLFRRADDRWGVAMELYAVGSARSGLGTSEADMARGEAQLRESKELFGAIGDRWGVAAAMMVLAGLAIRRNAYATAGHLAADALPLTVGGDIWLTAVVLGIIALALAGTERMRQAARLYAASIALRERAGLAIPAWEYDAIAPAFAGMRDALGEAAFAAAQAAGRELSIDDAIAEALTNAVWDE